MRTLGTGRAPRSAGEGESRAKADRRRVLSDASVASPLWS